MLNLHKISIFKNKLINYDPSTFNNIDNSFKFFLNRIKVNNFRHIQALDIKFDHPVTVITGTNKIGKTSLLLLIACSHENFQKYDSTKPDTVLKKHTWKDVLSLTSYEATTKNYSYEIFWRVGTSNKNGEGKRVSTSQAWTGLGKYSSDPTRNNAKIREKEVRLIDLERLLPARNFSNSLLRKISKTTNKTRLSEDIEKAFSYVLDIPSNVILEKIGSHINKIAYLINYSGEPYSSYNAASGEESLINILVDIIDTPNNSLILIDEIEAGFHPSVQRKLADIIQYVSWQHKKQFIITSHSPSVLAAFPQKSRKYIDKRADGTYETISEISVNTAFSKMDSLSYPLVQLYCEDDEAEFIIKNMLIEINQTHKNFNRLVNIIKSGAINQVKIDYERHKANYSQLRIKMGYCCIFDGDYKDNIQFSSYHNNPDEHTFFLYPYKAPEKFLVEAYLAISPDEQLQSKLDHVDHHTLFEEMENLGIATDRSHALNLCWMAFKSSSDYSQFENDIKQFLIKTITHFSRKSD